MTHAKTLVLYIDDAEIEVPTKWEICSHCRGNGTSSAYLGAFTSDSWNEMDDEFREDYIGGKYDRPCEHCSGTGKAQVADTERMSKEHRKAWREQQRAAAEDRAAERAEYLFCGGWREEGW